MTTQINDFEDILLFTDLPVCLQNTLHPYITARKTELDQMAQQRHAIGDLLSKASDLITFNEEMIKSGFAKIYQNSASLNGAGGDGTSLEHIQRPSDFIN